MPEFLSPVDIANRGLQHVGAEMIGQQGFAEPSKAARQTSFCYGKLRRAELQRNLWTFATRRAVLRALDSNTMLLDPSLWSVSATYFVGSIVADSVGTLWISRQPNNLNNQPGIIWDAWEPYFGPMSVPLYDPTQAYYAGELVYTMAGDGTNNVYLSRVNANALDPSLPNQWASTTTYNTNDVVQVYSAWSNATTYAAGAGVLYTDGNRYASLVAGNVNHPPSANPAFWALMPVAVIQSLMVPATNQPPVVLSTPVAEWNIVHTYVVGDFVMFNGVEYLSLLPNNTGNFPTSSPTFWVAVTGGTVYMSLVDLNLGNNPSTSPSQWSATFTQGPGNPQWMQIGGASFPFGVTLIRFNIVYPLGTGPTTQTQTRNIFRLPAGFLRRASEDPKAGGISYLGAPTQLPYDDYLIEGHYLVSAIVYPIMIRFVADVVDVTTFNDLFSEGLAARIGLEVCEPLTQSTTKLKSIAELYQRFMTDARTVNAIEMGPVEARLDDYIACRV
jgi:hypothetical protein